MNPFVKVFLILLLASGVLAVPYYVGKNAGQLEVSSAWAKEKNDQAAEIDRLQNQVERLQADNQKTTQRVADDLAAREIKHEKVLADVRADFTQRLLQSDSRQGIYKRQAQGTAAERDHLASYAAELDRSLEQGRSLVRELGETIRQRDDTIRLLSQQITADRLLLTETP